MKTILAVLAAIMLAGCVAVPVYEPAPAYGYYSPPAATFSFGYHYSDRDHRHRNWR